MENKINKFLYWAPRILAILFICFLALFSLDIFEMKLGFWETALGLFMHNIPALILLAILLISWKREIVGGIVFTLAGVFYAVMMSQEILKDPSKKGMVSAIWAIAVPALAIGALFIINWVKKRNNR